MCIYLRLALDRIEKGRFIPCLKTGVFSHPGIKISLIGAVALSVDWRNSSRKNWQSPVDATEPTDNLFF